MIGYYVHHHGRGHATRAARIAAACSEPVVGLSSAPRPVDWPGEWIELPDDAPDGEHPESTGEAADPTAGGALHWVPRGHPGLRARAARISAWIESERPRALVADVSVEVALLARLHGVPVVSVVLPGRRDDEPHRLGHRVSDALVAAWPPEASQDIARPDPEQAPRVHAVGGLSRFDRRPLVERPTATTRTEAERHVVVLSGTGGGAPLDLAQLDRARETTPGWTWTVVGGPGGEWAPDPWPLLCAADVVVCSAGQNVIAEVAASRTPAILVPLERPFDEQRWMGEALLRLGMPVLAVPGREDLLDWPALLERAATLDSAPWAAWVDGAAAHRAARVIEEVAGRDDGGMA